MQCARTLKEKQKCNQKIQSKVQETKVQSKNPKIQGWIVDGP